MAGPWRSAELAAAVAGIEESLEAAWSALLAEFGVARGSADEKALAGEVADDPSGHDWRTVDAAIARLTCPECGAPLTTGPVDCGRCAYAHGLRFAAREVDRPHVPPGNEHAIRVASAVVRTRGRYPPRARASCELVLPALIAGELPTTPQAQAAKAAINRLTPHECDTVTSLAEVRALSRRRGSPPGT
jgi:hypothetical protein